MPQNLPGRGGLSAAADLKDDPSDGTVIMMGATETFGYGMRSAGTGRGLAKPLAGKRPSIR